MSPASGKVGIGYFSYACKRHDLSIRMPEKPFGCSDGVAGGACNSRRVMEPLLTALRRVELEVILGDHSQAAGINQAARSQEGYCATSLNVVALLIWLLAGAVAFIPFAFDTSPWDAVTLRVPGNQGNWWHVLVGAPFFLAYPMIWLRVRAIFSTQPSKVAGRRLIWGAVGLSMVGTTLVQLPFLLHLAGTSEWQRLFILGLGFGIMVASAVLLFLRRRQIPPARACLVGLDTAYLANAALCLVVYSGATGNIWSRSGWLVCMVIVWPIAFEIAWLFIQTFGTRGWELYSR
jgi:hypothetical protein